MMGIHSIGIVSGLCTYRQGYALKGIQRFSRRWAHSGSNHGSPMADEHLFSYTSGRWLYKESLQLKKRYVKFNVEALKKIAAQILDSRCVGISKLSEGLYNKVFSLTMENGREILARIPNPNAGHSRYVVASEVATLGFLRDMLDIPVPKVLGWGSPSSQPNYVGVDYILMERVQGVQLSEVWETISEVQRFGLVKSLVEIEGKLASINPAYYGSLYYKDTIPEGTITMNLTKPSAGDLDVISNFVIGPTTERSFWVDERRDLGIDHDPWNTFEEYMSAIVHREISSTQKLGLQRLKGHSEYLGNAGVTPESHIQLLEKFLMVLPHILPPAEVTRPVLLHQDLHADNIFVHKDDPTKISNIIDWQAVYAAPLFLQARFASIVDCDDPYPWGAIQPELPEDFETLPEPQKNAAKDAFHRIRLKKFYELASRKFNPTLIKAMDVTRDDGDPTNFIFHIIGQTATDGPIPLKELLIQIYEKWDQISKRASKMTCPISFTQEEISNARYQAEAWADAFNEFEALRSRLAGKEGWVSHEEYEEAISRYNAHKDTLERLQKHLEKLS